MDKTTSIILFIVSLAVFVAIIYYYVFSDKEFTRYFLKMAGLGIIILAVVVLFIWLYFLAT